MDDASGPAAAGWKIALDAAKNVVAVPEEVRRERGASLPAAGMDSEGIRDPARYEPDPSLIDAIHAAIVLGQPLLLAGEPGCGKTEVANFVAYQFGLYPPAIPGERQEWALRFDVKSTTTARDLFYSFDTVGRFGAAKDEDAEARRPGRFITLSALGRAIMDAAPLSEVRDIEIANYRRAHEAARRSVVLIDEIDKAPRDVPNDLLMELERLAFRIAELNRDGDRPVRADPDHRPILIITSNSERALPDAFLRRCVFHFMAFPGRDRLGRIVEARIAGFPRGGALERDALDLLFGLRREPLLKLPGTAELLGFLTVLLAQGHPPDSLLAPGGADWTTIARGTLLKTKDDQERSLRDTWFAERLADGRAARPRT